MYDKDCNFKPFCLLIKSVLLRREYKQKLLTVFLTMLLINYPELLKCPFHFLRRTVESESSVFTPPNRQIINPLLS